MTFSVLPVCAVVSTRIGAEAKAATNPSPWLKLLAISSPGDCGRSVMAGQLPRRCIGHVEAARREAAPHRSPRSEEHTSELQSLAYLVCRLLLEKKKKTTHTDKLYTKKKQNTN